MLPQHVVDGIEELIARARAAGDPEPTAMSLATADADGRPGKQLDLHLEPDQRYQPAGEGGADYVAFGPVGESPLGQGTQAEFELFEWWSEMIEVPVIAEGALTLELVERFGPVTDFFAIGPEIWGAEDPAAALRALLAPLG